MPGEEDSAVYDQPSEALHLAVDSIRGQGPSRVPYDVKANSFAFDVNSRASLSHLPPIPGTSLLVHDNYGEYFTYVGDGRNPTKLILGETVPQLLEAIAEIKIWGEDAIRRFCLGRERIVRLHHPIRQGH